MMSFTAGEWTRTADGSLKLGDVDDGSDPASLARAYEARLKKVPLTQRERRIDSSNGKPYTKEAFVALYGGTVEWERAPAYEEPEGENKAPGNAVYGEFPIYL